MIIEVFEIESKFRVEDISSVQNTINDLLFKKKIEVYGVEDNEDEYFQGVDRDFKETGEALRLRVVNNEVKFTYKGSSSVDSNIKTRREIEFKVSTEREVARAFITCLGFKPVATVNKKRVQYSPVDDEFITISVDNVEGLGNFVEIEIVCGDKEFGIEKVKKWGDILGLKTPEDRSYLRMVLESRDS